MYLKTIYQDSADTLKHKLKSLAKVFFVISLVAFF